jgi:hypothetical protein
MVEAGHAASTTLLRHTARCAARPRRHPVPCPRPHTKPASSSCCERVAWAVWAACSAAARWSARLLSATIAAAVLVRSSSHFRAASGAGQERKPPPTTHTHTPPQRLPTPTQLSCQCALGRHTATEFAVITEAGGLGMISQSLSFPLPPVPSSSSSSLPLPHPALFPPHAPSLAALTSAAV